MNKKNFNNCLISNKPPKNLKKQELQQWANCTKTKQEEKYEIREIGTTIIDADFIANLVKNKNK